MGTIAITGAPPRAIKRATTNGSADTSDEITWPAWATTLLVRNQGTAAVKIALSAGGSDYRTIAASAEEVVPVTDWTDSAALYIESAATSQQLELVAIARRAM